MNPHWRSRALGGPRLRRVWRLTPRSEIRAVTDHSRWGRVEAAAMLPADWAPPGRLHLNLQVVADPDGVHPLYREHSVVDAQAAAYSRTPTRRIGRTTAPAGRPRP